jgi:hypothetical protein
MSDNFILNASPIILLGKADLLKTISPLAKSWIIERLKAAGLHIDNTMLDRIYMRIGE